MASSALQEYIPDELDIFANRPYLFCVKESNIHEYSPLNSTDGATSIEFLSLPYNDQYKDLSWTFLKLRLQLLKKGGAKYLESDDKEKQPHLATNALHSIFKSAYLSLNSVSLRNVESNYHYKEFIETTLNFHIESATSRLSSQMYIPNAEEKSLKDICKDSKVFELYGRINLMNLSKLLIPGVSLSIRFNLENPDFFIKEQKFKVDSLDMVTDSILKIHSAKLYVRHTVPSSEIILAHERLLSSGKSAIYEFKKGEVYSQNIAAGTSNLNVMNLYSGPKPSLIVFAMTENKGYSGDRNKNPFNFMHFDLQTFSFIVNGVSRPANPYNIQIDKTHECYSHIFSKVYESLGMHQSDNSNLITRANFAKDHFMILEDLSSFNISLSDINEMGENVSIGVSGTFAKNLPETITCVMYILVPSRFEITGSRKVIPIL